MGLNRTSARSDRRDEHFRGVQVGRLRISVAGVISRCSRHRFAEVKITEAASGLPQTRKYFWWTRFRENVRSAQSELAGNKRRHRELDHGKSTVAFAEIVYKLGEKPNAQIRRPVQKVEHVYFVQRRGIVVIDRGWVENGETGSEVPRGFQKMKWN